MKAFIIMPSLKAQDHSGNIIYDSKGKLQLPASLTREELEFLGTESVYVPRGVPFDSSSMFIKAKPIREFNAEVIRVSSRHEYTNLMDQAWTVMLYKQGIISLSDAKQVLQALRSLNIAAPNGKGATANLQNLGDSHESRLKELLKGDRYLSSIPQLGRTKQEPMARMQLRNKQLDVIDGVHSFLETLLNIIERHSGTIMPGMTHLSHAQPTTYGAYLLSVYDGYYRALEQLELAYKHTNENSGGCGATSGTGWNVDRYLVTELLGFDKLVEPTYDGEAGQDYGMTTLFALSNMMLTLSRTAMDHEIWGMEGYYTHILADHHKEVSSFMPQKGGNGGAQWEEVRICTNNVLGAMMLGTLALNGEPLADVLTAYQAAYLSRSAGAIGALCEAEMINSVAGDMLNTLIVDKDKLFRLTKDGWGCTPDLAVSLMREKGYGMREAHQICAVMVRIARVHRKIKPSELTGEMLDEAAIIAHAKEPGLTTREIQEIMDPVKFIERHNNTGDPNPKETERIVKIRHSILEESRQRQQERRQRVEVGYKKLMNEVNEILFM
ncbi:MAG: lyase family protein [Mangrovibacterium sp.]